MNQMLRVACVGAGYFSRFHYDAWRRIEIVELVGSADRNTELAKATGLSAYGDLGTMLAETSPDVVDIVTPPGTHLGLIKRALDARLKAVICQKPFCNNLDEAREVVCLSEAVGIPVIVHENFRFQPWYRTIKSQIEGGHIGDVLQLTFRLRPGDGQGPEAYLDRQPYFQRMPRFLVHESAVHWIDTFRFLMGEPNEVFADLRKMNPAIAGEDAGHILFRYDKGVRALFDANRLLDHAAENTRCTMGEALIEGTTGTITLEGDGSVLLRRFGETEATVILEASTHDGFGGDCVYHLQNHIAQTLCYGGKPENLAVDYLPVVEQEKAIYASAETGTWVQLRKGPKV